MWNGGLEWSVRAFQIPQGQAAIRVTTHELLPFMMPSNRMNSLQKSKKNLRLEWNTVFTPIVFSCMTSDYIVPMVYQELDRSCLFEVHYCHFLATDGCNPHFIMKANVTQ